MKFRRGAAASDRDPVDDKVQRRLRELAAGGPPALPVDEDDEVPPVDDVDVEDPGDGAESTGDLNEPPALAGDEPPEPPDAGPPPPGDATPRRRLWLGAVAVVLFAVAAWIVVGQIDARRPHGWRSESNNDAVLDSWPDRPSDAEILPIGQPPLEVPQADTYDFRKTQGGPDDPITYDPCVPIHYVVNDRKAFDGADKELKKAIDELEAATGLVLVDDGDTEERPVDDRGAQDAKHYGARWSPVLIAWSDGYESSELKGGRANFASSQIARRNGHKWYVTGSAVFDGPQLGRIYRDEGGAERVRAVIMHNLGHLVGLGHVTAPDELMRATPGDVAAWGPGDRAGLARLGGGQCVDY